MANLSLTDFKEALAPFLLKYEIDIESHKKTDLLIESMRSSGNTLNQIASNLLCYYGDVKEYDQKAIKKFINNSDDILCDLKKIISELDIWTEESIDSMLAEYRELKELPVPKVNQPIRIALTGSTNSPSLGMTLYLFEKEEVLKRVNNLMSIVDINS
jgi:glutamyl-tRNA synthetase